MSRAPLPSPPPYDPELRKRIETLAEYYNKNGPNFEAMIMEKNRGNPDFAFMYGGPGMDYYMWRKYCVYMRWSEDQINDQVRSYMAHAFQRPPVAVAPPPQQQQQQQQHFAPDPYQHHMQAPIPQPRLPLAGDREHVIRTALMQLNGSKDSIFGTMHTILGHFDGSPDSARTLAEMIRTHVESIRPGPDPEPFSRCLFTIYLITELLLDDVRRRSALPFSSESAGHAPSPLCAHILAQLAPILRASFFCAVSSPMSAPADIDRLTGMIGLWRERQVFADDVFVYLNEQMRVPPGSPLPALPFSLQQFIGVATDVPPHAYVHAPPQPPLYPSIHAPVIPPTHPLAHYPPHSQSLPVHQPYASGPPVPVPAPFMQHTMLPEAHSTDSIRSDSAPDSQARSVAMASAAAAAAAIRARIQQQQLQAAASSHMSVVSPPASDRPRKGTPIPGCNEAAPSGAPAGGNLTVPLPPTLYMPRASYITDYMYSTESHPADALSGLPPSNVRHLTPGFFMHVAMDSKGPSYAPVDAKSVPRLMPRPAKLTSEEASFFADLLDDLKDELDGKPATRANAHVGSSRSQSPERSSSAVEISSAATSHAVPFVYADDSE